MSIEGGRVLSGTLDKRAIGAEDGRLLDAVVQTHGTATGAKFLNEMTKLTIGICTALGFTTGIDDEDLPAEARELIALRNAEASWKLWKKISFKSWISAKPRQVTLLRNTLQMTTLL